jgi:histone deacetylase 8
MAQKSSIDSHHASKSHAAGFCYVSDCVLALLALRRQPQSPTAGPQLSSAQPSAPPHRRRRRRRVMYIDLDLHFGDGVCEAFSQSVQRGPTGTTATAAQVLTLSIHHAAPGFYPLSPLAALPRPPGIAHPRPSSEGPHDDDDDERPFDPYTLALPLERGTSDATLARVWDTAVEPVRAAFSPDAVLVQCGADGLAGDPCAVWNVSAAGLGACVNAARGWGCKLMLVGGGGGFVAKIRGIYEG